MIDGPETQAAISVVVPMYNEEDNVARLVDAVRAALDGVDVWELILVDDGSSDGTVGEINMASAADQRVVAIALARNYGQTTAMQAGFDHARGTVIVSMDGDLQNDPADIPKLVAKLGEGYDLVTGYRVKRQDKISRKIPSWIANRIIAWLTGVRIRDNGCSLKAYRTELVRRLHLYSDMHRFIPAVAASLGGARIAEIPVRHHARQFGESKYGFSRIAKVLADLLTVTMIRSFRHRPLLMFGGAAAAAAAAAAVFTVAWIVAATTFTMAKAVALVLPASALLFLGLAAYLLMLGIIAESILDRYLQDQGAVSDLAVLVSVGTTGGNG